MNKSLSTNLNTPSSIPYFLWDEPLTVAELKQKLSSASVEERNRLLGKILREARDTDVWKFTTPQEVWRNWDGLEKHLGRRREFWKFLCSFWDKEGLLGECVKVRENLMIFRLTERDLKTKFGDFREILYYDGQTESIALVMGNVENAEDIFCRIHSSCISARVFSSIECECREEMEISQRTGHNPLPQSGR